jgi:hypothetical protein
MNRIILFTSKIILLIAGSISLALIPVSFFEQGNTICLFKNLLNFECPGCGMGRAISCIFHGELEKAFLFNKLVFIVLPLLYIVYFKNLYHDYKLISGKL